LANIFSQVGIPHEPINESEKVCVVLLDEPGKGINVNALDTLDYGIVIH
jgi:hypothetical protein